MVKLLQVDEEATKWAELQVAMVKESFEGLNYEILINTVRSKHQVIPQFCIA
jgi:hypothetical protein